MLNYHVIIVAEGKEKRIHICDRVGVDTHLMCTTGFRIVVINNTSTYE